jgi:3-hydroxyisobutyrate dehydrogenase-like beta-hydroxyacid dehydrogenase
MIKKVGFVGLGAMGRPMAENLIKKGFETYVVAHTNRQPIEELIALGAKEAKNGAEMAAEVEAIVTMVPDAPQVEEACFGENGIAAGAKAGLIVADMSTISPTASQNIAKRLKEKGIEMVDAPVSGGPFRAASGTLTIMVGAEEEIFAKVKPVLEAMGTPTLLGGNGMGEVVKLVNNIIISVSMIGLIEGFSFGVKAGVNAETLREVLMTATSGSYLMDKWITQNLLKGDFSTGFATELMHKDISAALSAAKDLGVPMMATAFAHQLYAMAKAMGYNRDDYSVVSKLYSQATGVEIASSKKD